MPGGLSTPGSARLARGPASLTASADGEGSRSDAEVLGWPESLWISAGPRAADVPKRAVLWWPRASAAQLTSRCS